MKKTIIFVVIFLAILGGAYIGFNSLNKDVETSNIDTSNEDEEYFKKLIQYKAETVTNEENLYELLRNIELGEYVIDIKKEFEGEKEYITIYYNCIDEITFREYYAKYHNSEILEKNAVTLFALINRLEKVSFNFNISDIELPTGFIVRPETYYDWTRDLVEKKYNQDVRNYVENPSQFMKYAISSDINNITIYTIEYNAEGKNITSIEVNDKIHIDNIVRYIKTQSFKSKGSSTINSICLTWVDLNNGYIIGLLGKHQDMYHGRILKGDGKEIFSNPDDVLSKTGKYVEKVLPAGLGEYLQEIIKNIVVCNR